MAASGGYPFYFVPLFRPTIWSMVMGKNHGKTDFRGQTLGFKMQEQFKTVKAMQQKVRYIVYSGIMTKTCINKIWSLESKGGMETNELVMTARSLDES